MMRTFISFTIVCLWFHSGLAQSDLPPLRPGMLRVYGYGLSDAEMSASQLARMGVNLFYLPVSGRALANEVEGCHELGIRVATVLSMTRVSDAEGSQIQVVVDRSGTRRGWGDGSDDVILCISEPSWSERWAKRIQNASRSGIDLIHLREVQAPPCYCVTCKRRWSSYARENLGFEVTVKNAASSSDRRVRSFYSAFRYDSVIARLSEILQIARSCERPVRLCFTSHMTPRGVYLLSNGRDCHDMACIEFTTAEREWFPPEGESLVGYKICYACSRRKPVWGIDKLLRRIRWREADSGDLGEREIREDDHVSLGEKDEWDRMNPSIERFELYLAEALASGAGAAPVVLETTHAQAQRKQIICYRDIISAYYSFLREHEQYYTQARSLAPIAVLLSVDSWVFDDRSRRAFYGLCEALLREHYLFDILIAETLREEALNRYQVVIVPESACIPRLAARHLLRKLQAGTGVLRAGECRVASERYTPGVSFEQFFAKEAAKGTATGRLEKLSFSPAELFQKFNERPASMEKTRELHRALRGMHQFNFSIMGANGSLVVGECCAVREAVVLHLLNYNFDIFPGRREQDKIDVETVKPVTDIDVSVPLPPNRAARRVTSFSPLHPPRRLAFSEYAGVVGFRLPELRVYELVVIETAWGQ